MNSGKKILAALLAASLLIPQSVFGADLSAAESVGMAAISSESQNTSENGQEKADNAAADENAESVSEVSNQEEKNAEETLSGVQDLSTDRTGSENSGNGSSENGSENAAGETDSASVLTEASSDESKVQETVLPGQEVLEEDVNPAEEVVGAPSNDAQIETGVYYICLKKKYNRLIGSKDNSEAHCANIELVEKTCSKKQKWVVTALGDGKYSIWNYSSGMALGVAGVTLRNNANMSQYRRNYKNVKQYYIRKTSDGAVIIQPVGGSFVVAAASSQFDPGVNVRLTSYTGQTEAKWRFAATKTSSQGAGTFIVHSKLDDSKYISIDGASRKSGGNCILSGSGSAKQMTICSAADGGRYLIHPACSLYTLTAYGNVTNGSDVRQYKVTNAARQLWTFHDEGNGYYSIRSARNSNMALDVTGGSAKDGTNIGVYSYNGSDAQLFSFEKTDGSRILPNGNYALQSSLDTKMAVEIANNSKDNAANVQLGTYNNKNKQKYYISYGGNGYYYIKNVRSGKCLDVAGGSSARGTNVWQYTPNSSNAQKWRPVGSAGVFYFKSALGNIALDVSAAQAAVGTNIQVYTVNKSSAQKFKLVPVTVSEEKEYTVAIDAGHQRHQNTGREQNGPGSSTLKQKVTSGTSGDWSGLDEYELNLQVSLKLQAELEKRGYNVYMVRTTHDVNISNAERAQMATSAGADIFIRIHANGADSSSVRGALNYMPSSSNRYLSQPVIAGSQRLARILLDSYCAATGMPNLGLLEGDDMTGINWATMPVTIVEMGFMSNRTDDLYMASASGQAAIVQGLANGVDRYFNS